MSALKINTAELRFATSGGYAPFGQGVNFVKKSLTLTCINKLPYTLFGILPLFCPIKIFPPRHSASLLIYQSLD